MKSLFLKIFLWFWLAMALVVIVFIVLVANTQQQRDRGNDSGPGPQEWNRLTTNVLTIRVETAESMLARNGLAAATGYLDRLDSRGQARTYLFDARGAELLHHGQSRRHGPPPDDSDHGDGRHRHHDDAFGPGRDGPQRDVQSHDDGWHPGGAPWPRGGPPDGGDDLQRLVRLATASRKLEIQGGGPVLLGARRVDTPAAASPYYVVTVAMNGWRMPPPDHDHGPRGGLLGFWWWLLVAEPEPRIQALRLLIIFLTTGVVCYGLVRHLTSPILELRAAAQRLAAGDLSTRVGPKLARRGDELGVLGRDFDRMAERLETLMKAQNRLIADISHELRSPLARVGVALGLVRGTAGPEATEDLDRIELETERLNTMIGQVLTISRLESGAQAPATDPVDLAVLVRDIAADANFEARSHDRAVRLVTAEPCIVTGTPMLLRSAVENVVRNAVRFTSPATSVEISLTCHADRDEHGYDRGGTAVITVRDHGPGVPEAALSQLFRPFYRVADARDRQSGGTGLGLAITEQAVRLHGGTVTAANAPDGGLQVDLCLPVGADKSQ